VLIIEAPLINAQGVQTGWMSAFLDISEQRRVEELSRASQERLQATARLATVGEMASLLSHELNQPLAAISSYATGSLNLLERSPAAARPRLTCRWPLRRIAEQAERAGKVIKSVHDFVRRRDNDREPVAAAGAHRRHDAAGGPAGAQAGRARRDAACRRPCRPVLCDRTMVEQVLLNLARNAMQAMDQAGVRQRSLLIQVRRAGAGRQRRVARLAGVLGRRPGPGHSRATCADQLFTPFFTTKAEGMGLGLSLCRTVVEQHGGFLAFEANRPQGTVFRFTLPTQPGPRPTLPAPAETGHRLMQPAPDATVFIVDDDESVREALAWLLRSRHLPSERFAAGEDFEAMLADGWEPSQPCCLLLDVRMPGLSGLALFERLADRASWWR
jgi:two-component system sensor histidine kinase DctS